MEKKQNDFETSGIERMTDAELSKKLGHYQRTESIGIQKLEASSRSAKLCGLILRDGDLALALNTRYVFAGVPEELDLRDIDGIRKWFTASLTGMGNLLDLITESPALTGAAE